MSLADRIPLPAGAKYPPPAGVTGGAGVSTWRPEWDGHTGNWGLRLPDGLIGLDVDGADHDIMKVGDQAISEAESVWGALPDGPYSTRHGAASETRIRLFRVPSGVRLSEDALIDVEVIQHGHRYMVVSPSVVDGNAYEWYPTEPTLAEVPELPARWVEALRADAVPVYEPADGSMVSTFLESLPDRPTGPETSRALAAAAAKEGDDSTLLWKVRRVLFAVVEDGSEADVQALHDLLHDDYASTYGEAAWARQWPRALSKAVGAILADIDSVEDEVEPEDDDLLTFVSIDELLARPAPNWYVPGLLMESSVAILAGHPGVGKSFLALDMAACISLGETWWGHETRQGRVMYVAGEGVAGTGERVRSWEAANRRLDREQFHFVEAGVNLSDADSVRRVAKTVAARQVDLVILDTFAQLAAVENENDAAQVGAALRAARDIRMARPGATVLIVHHTGTEGKRVRGSSALEGNVDSVIIARRTSTGITLSTKPTDGGKQKDAEPVNLLGFDLQAVGKSAVVVRSQLGDDATIDKVLSDGEAHPMSDFLAEAGETTDAARKRLARRLDRLVDTGRVEAEGMTRSRTYRAPKPF